MLRLRHAARLGRDVAAYAAVNRTWWLVPVVLALALVAVTVTVAHLAVPATMYTLF